MIESFKNRTEAHGWLLAHGYKISQRHFYRAVQQGLVILQPDGSILKTSLDRYIAMTDLKQPATESVAAAAAADAKAREEIKQLVLKNERLEHELAVLRGDYVKKIDAEAYAADLAALLDAVPRHILQLNGPRYLAGIGADPARARQLYELFDQDFTNAVNRICEDGGANVEGGEDADDAAA